MKACGQALQELLRVIILLQGSTSAHTNAEALKALQKAHELIAHQQHDPLPEKKVSSTQPSYHAYHARQATQQALKLLEEHLSAQQPESLQEAAHLIREAYEIL
ncbi:hypothetical protein [Deinococcus cellulosilyticus]|uniref:Uncharacterized protein n=1 Tax=Deinococcus cellulosilyticus (strain DSM 18568 / NBRC 106333 / KACC 11606 / 5516J-15) TaxID=1223518 RepID=A0A511N4U7_DEIC1|nr:hypothetical protein [Deinococcus cellulosilyticus]GEM47865.1 hypothetical protein DC3_35000 [Deinococcus cellulosilyticus NBRC 106333 = KACC 11606]